ncbi:MAG TPA: phosphoenolpyruvate--protein phosphotransferase [Acidobacteriota bacterium]
MKTKRYRRKIRGNAISPGYALGNAVHYFSPGHVFRLYIPDDAIDAEIQRLQLAVDQSRRELMSLRSRIRDQSGEETAGIFDAHQMILDDPALLERIVALIQTPHANAEWAARQALEELQAEYEGVADEFFKQREMDTQGLFERLHRHLTGAAGHEKRGDIALVADTLNLALLADFDLNDLRGIVVSTGGYTSHTAIIARSYSIPVISGIIHVRERIPAHERIVLDGYSGIIYVDPSEELVREFEEKVRQERQRLHALIGEKKLPAVTCDGERVILEVNAETEAEVTSALGMGAEGIGLFRSEFLYVCEKDGPPSEDKQAALYARLAQRLYPLPFTIRTLDIGDEKLRYLNDVKNTPNPILGLRGIRLSLAKPVLFKTQLRAILRASTLGNVKIVLPMISSLDEVRDAKSLLAEAQEELKQEKYAFDADIEVGIMMEVPAAFFSAAVLAREVDFLSIGTNDLIQYVLAVDRTNEQVAGLYDPLHPTVLRCLRDVMDVASQQRIPARVCGEMASDSIFALILIGMGVRNLSLNPAALPYIRRLVRSTTKEKIHRAVEDILRLDSPREIHRYVMEHLNPLIPSDPQELHQPR